MQRTKDLICLLTRRKGKSKYVIPNAKKLQSKLSAMSDNLDNPIPLYFLNLTFSS